MKQVIGDYCAWRLVFNFIYSTWRLEVLCSLYQSFSLYRRKARNPREPLTYRSRERCLQLHIVETEKGTKESQLSRTMQLWGIELYIFTVP
ncbi:hypothetical protein C5167_006948 [Papaver somniferum]|uniref:Uncharacterized protein n=1 Tax=Papaver somniferum TaxID=3469 RepID=A0A4Y7JEZ0_PAPSO|nr:hypothetical protein C5167_006948 [Papaver somniferum]